MNSVGMLLGRWHKRFVCFVWLIVTIELLAGRRYLDFLRPEFSYALWLMVIILIGFIVSDIDGMRMERIRPAELFVMAALLLPVPYLLNARGAALDSQAFERRYVSGSSPSVDISEYRVDEDGEMNLITQDNEQTEGKETSILDMYYNPDAYLGKRVSIVGMLERENEQIRTILNRKCPVVFRFTISCCAADAMPLAMVVDSNISPELSNNTWVRAAGVFTVRKINDLELPFIENAEVSAEPKPKQPYLY